MNRASPLLIGTLFIATYAFFALEARKEIYYLCGNFKEGVSYSSVVRQLETSDLSVYTIEEHEEGKRITHSSMLHLNLLHCEINFDNDEQVSRAIYKY